MIALTPQSLKRARFEFARNDRFDSRLFFATTKPIMRQQQFGGSLGGPIKTNKTFFFADYEGYRQTQGVPVVITVPTLKMRSGDFSELSTAIYDPTTTTRTPFAGNIIPTGRLDPIALKYLSLYPLPTSGGLANARASARLVGGGRSCRHSMVLCRIRNIG